MLLNYSYLSSIDIATAEFWRAENFCRHFKNMEDKVFQTQFPLNLEKQRNMTSNARNNTQTIN